MKKEEFPGQKPKEKHIKTFRKSFSRLTKKFLIFAVLATISIFLIVFLSQVELLSIISNYINISGILVLVLALSYGFYVWLTWYYDVYVLTSERIIEVHQKGIFSREVKEIELTKVEDVTYAVTGFMSTIFEIGNVNVKSSSGMTIDMEKISKPSLVRELIVKLAEKKHRGKKELSTEALAEELLKRMQQ